MSHTAANNKNNNTGEDGSTNKDKIDSASSDSSTATTKAYLTEGTDKENLRPIVLHNEGEEHQNHDLLPYNGRYHIKYINIEDLLSRKRGNVLRLGSDGKLYTNNLSTTTSPYDPTNTDKDPHDYHEYPINGEDNFPKQSVYSTNKVVDGGIGDEYLTGIPAKRTQIGRWGREKGGTGLGFSDGRGLCSLSRPNNFVTDRVIEGWKAWRGDDYTADRFKVRKNINHALADVAYQGSNRFIEELVYDDDYPTLVVGRKWYVYDPSSPKWKAALAENKLDSVSAGVSAIFANRRCPSGKLSNVLRPDDHYYIMYSKLPDEDAEERVGIDLRLLHIKDSDGCGFCFELHRAHSIVLDDDLEDGDPYRDMDLIMRTKGYVRKLMYKGYGVGCWIDGLAEEDRNEWEVDMSYIRNYTSYTDYNAFVFHNNKMGL